jgi:hypothetical protein
MFIIVSATTMRGSSILSKNTMTLIQPNVIQIVLVQWSCVLCPTSFKQVLLRCQEALLIAMN